MYEHVRKFKSELKVLYGWIAEVATNCATLKNRALDTKKSNRELHCGRLEAQTQARGEFARKLKERDEEARRINADLEVIHKDLKPLTSNWDIELKENAIKVIVEFKESNEFCEIVLYEGKVFYVRGFFECHEMICAIDPSFFIEKLNYQGEDVEGSNAYGSLVVEVVLEENNVSQV
ncbi:hypothetical protein O6P43_026097 [Quillaja saponaria]|uniref:Uncharacterized protein n=1 Tax=Quillaja saponaria TaxID=32244 RepID=A0AAD7PGZ3_QUISA|nr:hypothetical protein O6P43_026097 [Quillaja saponaria]